MKKCKKCYKVKPLTDFGNSKLGKLGKKSKCSVCLNLEGKERSRTVNGLIANIYSTQQSRSKLKDAPALHYTQDELSVFMKTQEEFASMFIFWEESGYDKFRRPSIDRVDDHLNYSLDNIQLLTWRENLDKACRDRLQGNNTKKLKSIRVYDINGKYIEDVYSVAETARRYNTHTTNIHECAVGNKGMFNGYIFRYTKDAPDAVPPYTGRKSMQFKPVTQIDKETGRTLATFKNAKEACSILKVLKPENIYTACKGNIGSAYGYKWKFT